ncbi:hypothetical protein [Candidatus Chromulinivorax destructor]|nr:hypothetical protein [Candidatus Chromulinivorax destructor]
MYKTRGSFLVLLLCSFMNVCCHTQTENQRDHTITVFVHGTSVARRMINMSPLRPRVYCPQGLTLAIDLPKNYHYHQMAQSCADLHNELYSVDRFYLFGWRSESFSHKNRMKSAKKLMKSLEHLAAKYYEKHSIIPDIRLIGFSHGGNVVLDTAYYAPLKISDQTINIEAWLLGTPIQRINHDCVNHSHFQKVYSVYSKKDWLQRIDPQGIVNKKARKAHFWSDRVFDADARCVQVKFTVNSQSIRHTSYRSIFKYFPSIQKLIEQAAQGLDTCMVEVDFTL